MVKTRSKMVTKILVGDLIELSLWRRSKIWLKIDKVLGCTLKSKGIYNIIITVDD